MDIVTTERKKCRKCRNGKLDTRVKRGTLVKALFFWLPLKRYRCDSCNKKSYVFSDTFKKHQDLQLL